MPDRNLLWKLWPATMSGFLPLLAVVCLRDALDDGLSRSLVADLVLAPVVWALFSLLAALYVYAALARRARGTGIPVTADALAATQERVFPARAARRLRAGLVGSARAFDVTDGEDALEFRWRPFRGRHAVTGALTVDEASGGVRVRLYADEGLTNMPGQRRAGAFVALCEIARLGEEA